jgi:hypothetical protein
MAVPFEAHISHMFGMSSPAGSAVQAVRMLLDQFCTTSCKVVVGPVLELGQGPQLAGVSPAGLAVQDRLWLVLLCHSPQVHQASADGVAICEQRLPGSCTSKHVGCC